MKEKIELYQEVLSWEPNSKVFFPLARLLVKDGRPDEALRTLREGLLLNPDFLEARLLMVELLDQAGQGTEAAQAVSPLAEVFGRYPGFWQAWALSLPPDQADFSVALGMAGAHLAGTPLNWSRIIEEGFKTLFGKAQAAPVATRRSPSAQANGLRPELRSGVGQEQSEAASLRTETGGIRTRTMADLLATQGDYPGALDIYQELESRAVSAQERGEIAARLAELRARLESEGSAPTSRALAAPGAEEPGFPSKNKLIKTLERLAARLEARAGG